MRFSFIHAADLHIDSPLAGLGLKDAAVAERFGRAGRKAVESLVEQTIAEKSAFLLIAGDIFDGDWRDYASGLFFVRMLGRLHREGIPSFIIKGNHDADSLMSRSLDYPASTRLFSSSRAETHVLDALGVAIHGRSFPQRAVPDDFVASYPAARPGLLNIGLLHTGLDGRSAHAAYAPCTSEDLRRFGYQYWALGHIHAAAEIARDPWIVYPGNVQGRSVRETGPKGAVRVSVEDGRIVEVAPIVLDAARWADEALDISDCDSEAAVLAKIDGALRDVHAAAQGRPLAARLRLVGFTPLHSRLVAGREQLQAEARSAGFAIAEECWVEQVRIETRAPARARVPPAEADALDLEALLEAAAGDQSFAGKIEELVRAVADKLPRDLRELFDAPDLRFRLAREARDTLLGRLAGGAEP
jgi:DNA repair exonuclease SbcCD nuclease subunit